MDALLRPGCPVPQCPRESADRPARRHWGTLAAAWRWPRQRGRVAVAPMESALATLPFSLRRCPSGPPWPPLFCRRRTAIRSVFFFPCFPLWALAAAADEQWRHGDTGTPVAVVVGAPLFSARAPLATAFWAAAAAVNQRPPVGGLLWSTSADSGAATWQPHCVLITGTPPARPCSPQTYGDALCFFAVLPDEGAGGGD